MKDRLHEFYVFCLCDWFCKKKASMRRPWKLQQKNWLPSYIIRQGVHPLDFDLRWSFVSSWLGWLELLALGRSGFVSQPAFAGHVAQKAASLALCAGFSLYTTCLVGVGVGSRGWPCRSATQRSGDGLCGPHLGSARGGHLRVNLLRKLCFRGLKMVSAGPLFIGWAGHTRKNRGGCAGLTVSELGLSLLSFSGRNIASKTCQTGWWGTNKRRGGGQGLFKFSVSHFCRWGIWV